MELNSDILQRIKICGALGYNARRIAVLIELPEKDLPDFLCAFSDKTSPIFVAYEQGVTIGSYNQDAALMKAAEKGDLFAIQELKDRQSERELEDDRKERFGI